MSDLWPRCLVELKGSFSAELYRTWFAELQADESALDENKLRLTASSNAKVTALKTTYAPKLAEILERVAGKPVTILWHVASQESRPTSPALEKAPQETPTIIHEDKSGLLPTLTMENFVQGKANQMAIAAALQVANSAGKPLYNPLIIYGGVGLGKTHLMHAIGHQFRKNKPNSRILCISAQQYLEEFTTVMRLMHVDPNQHFQAKQNFENRYQNLDLLLIDDIQGFASRQGTQASFFQVFEHMVPRGKQIVMTSDTYPRDLKELQERLLSRITQGITVEVEPPELEMRIQILIDKAQKSNLAMPLDVAETIAKRLKSNVRELEGAVQQILAFTNFHKVPLTVESATEALRDLFRSSLMPVTIEAIQQAVCEYYKVKTTDLLSKKRTALVSNARQVAMYLSKELTQKSLPEIGVLFGGKDHTTVLYAHRKVSAARSTNDVLRNDLHLLEQRIKN